MSIPTREEAWAILTEYTQSDALLKHALSVEAAMRAYASRAGADPELWGVTGLLHDFDYERYPSLEDHPFRGSEILAERGVSEEIRAAILGHGNHTGVARETPMARTLFAVDELCGFLTACALVRPGKRVADVPVKSVKKKMKDKAFARGVNRDDIRQGAEELGVDLDAHIEFVRDALAGVAAELGLEGDGSAT
ncbi:MAG: HDIG domain-containing protein [Gemmatimonadetes bacterium]|nr:HDIG domain-containing protein [Gemmatimonadota bacterium]